MISALAFEHPISFNVDSVIYRGHGGGLPSLMSPIFDQEPKNLCDRFDAFEKKAIRVIAICTSFPGVIVAVVAVLKFLGRL